MPLRYACGGGKRKGKRGRGSAGKVPVFGILKRDGKVYTKIIPDALSATLMPIITRKITLDSIVYTDCWRGYNALDVAEFKHYRINHSMLFAKWRFNNSEPKSQLKQWAREHLN